MRRRRDLVVMELVAAPGPRALTMARYWVQASRPPTSTMPTLLTSPEYWRPGSTRPST